VALLASVAPAAGSAQAVVSRAAYALPPFAELSERQRRGVERDADSAEYDSTRLDGRFRLEKIRYRSDGLEVVAYLYGPPASVAGGVRPLIVYNRGSWVEGDVAPALAPRFRRLALEGYTIVAPQYRGSDGGEGRDELGGADVGDVLAAVALGRLLEGVDSTRVYMYGESRGGMMTFQAVRDGAPVLAAAVVGAFTDFEATVAGDEQSRRAAPRIWPDLETRRTEIAARRSALGWAERLGRPLLLLHGADDSQISPLQSLRLAMRLEELGAPYELHVIAGEGHTLGGRARERDRMVAAWFGRHAPGPAATK
jgi:dipeptidyl aminopeptidase/acylaminoacyl peptidase